MAFKVDGDVLTITLPTRYEDEGDDLPKAQVVGPSWMTFQQKRRITSYSQKENAELGYLTDLSKMSEMALVQWAAGEVSGRIRDRQGTRVLPFAADTVAAPETNADDLDYISLVVSHVFFPLQFPFPPMTPEELSADPNDADAVTPTTTPPEKPKHVQKKSVATA